MIGIMSTQSPRKATSGQSMDDDNPDIKSPSSATVRKSMITSFFKPKALQQSPETHQNNLFQRTTNRHPVASGTEDPGSDTEKGNFEVKASDKGQKSSVISKGQVHDDLDGLLDPEKDVAYQTSCLGGASQGHRHPDLGGKVKESTSRLKHIKSLPRKAARIASLDCLQKESRDTGMKVPSRCSADYSGGGKSSKKRKKKVELNSSSDDFEVDKRTKIPKKEPSDLQQEIKTMLDGQVTQEKIPGGGLLDNEAASSCSDEDIFEVEEPTDNPKVISYLDFLNESMGENQDGDEINYRSDTETKEIEEKAVEEDHHVVKKPQIDAEELTRGKHPRKKLLPAKRKKVPNTSTKFNTSTKTKDACTKTGSVLAQTKARAPNERSAELNSDACLSEDDSVLTISYSEILDDNTASQSVDSPSLSLAYPKQKLVTFEAEVHTRPWDEVGHPGNSPVEVDLCHSPELLQRPASKKRTSNVVVSVSDLDLMIVSTDDASASADGRRSKTVYSIFQKKRIVEKLQQTESKASKKPKPTETSEDAKDVSKVKPKRGRPKKQHTGVDVSPEKKSRTQSRNADETLKKSPPKTQKGRRAKKTLTSIFGGKSEEENTEEEFEDEVSKQSKEGSNKRRGRPKRTISKNDENDEDGEETKERGTKQTFQQAEVVVLTTTPRSKAKTNKNAKARQLLRRAKSQQMSKASAFPAVDEDIEETNCATQVDQKRSTNPGSVKQAKKPRDLTNVLGRRVVPKEEVNEEGKDRKTTKSGEKRRSVITDVQERKSTKLAPMFTKEGRQALSRKQQCLERQTSNPCVMVVSDDDDEASRDSVCSDAGGRAKLFSDALGKNRESETQRSYPPFPTISHVLQMAPEIDGNGDWWKLPAPVSLGKFLTADRNYTSKSICKKLKMVGRLLRLGEFTRCNAVDVHTPLIKSFTGHPELSHDIQRVILDQIKADNPRFPVNRVFKRYLAKRKGEPLIPKPLQGEGTSEVKFGPKADSNFTKLKAGRPPAKRKSEVLEQRANTKRRKVAQEGSAENSEAEFVGKIRLRRRSSRWVIRDDEEEETKDAKEQPKPRRSSRQSEQSVGKEGGATEPKEGRTVRARRGKTTEAEKDGRKEGCGEATTAKTDKLASLPWTEKYQPLTSAEIIGNGQAMKRLTGWLAEWKKKTARIKKKMKRQRGKQQNKTLLALPIEDSDSDFDLGSDGDNSDDSEDEDDSLSNAMLIVGPCGCGKTTAVYACAKELGFKVFEVNASSKRTGKQILADLGEATQSHHLTAHHHGNSNGTLKSFFPAKSPPKFVAKLEAKGKPIPKAFAAFYKVGADAAATKQGGKKTKAVTKKSPKTSQVKQSKPVAQTPTAAQPLRAAAVMSGGCKDGALGQRLTSTSLILFEDVDVVFEEDKGFLSAIATFLKTTKRPIILTTSDGRFPEMFEERCETVTFQKPSSSQLATHLQLLCLAENVTASHSDLHRLVSLLDRDVRRCFLAGQLWVNSGADRRSKAEDFEYPELGSTAPDETSKMDTSSKVLDDGRTETNKRDGCQDALTRMQSNCFESTMGLCNLSGGRSGIYSMLNIHRSDGPFLHTSSAITVRFQKENNASVFFRNIHTLLTPISSLCVKLENSTDQSQVEPKPLATNGRAAAVLNHKLVNSLATFADDLSFLDSHTFCSGHDGKGRGGNGWWGAEVKSSLSLDAAQSDSPNYVMSETASSIRGFLEAASFKRCHKNYEKAVGRFRQLQHRSPRGSCHNEMKEGTPPTTTNPAEIQSKCNQDSSVLKLHQDDGTKCPDIYSTIVNKLPLSVHGNHRVLAMEYLPTLRCICRTEQIREELKIKRRFLHYLDSVSLNVKKTDQITLCSIMEGKRTATQKHDDPKGSR